MLWPLSMWWQKKQTENTNITSLWAFDTFLFGVVHMNSGVFGCWFSLFGLAQKLSVGCLVCTWFRPKPPKKAARGLLPGEICCGLSVLWKQNRPITCFYVGSCVITFAKEAVFSPVPVCWLVGLSAGLNKNCNRLPWNLDRGLFFLPFSLISQEIMHRALLKTIRCISVAGIYPSGTILYGKKMILSHLSGLYTV